MGIPVGKHKTEKLNGNRGFTLLEQLIAAGLILTASLCILEALAYCLLSLQASEEKWNQEILEWNESQVEMIKNEESYEEEFNFEENISE